MIKAAIITVCLGFIAVEAGRIPPDLERCKITDTTCFEKQFNKALRMYTKGIPSLGVPPIDPLNIDQIKIVEDNKGKSRRPINLDMEFKNIDLIGLSKCEIFDVKGFDKIEVNKKNKVELKIKGPGMKMIGQYKINGNVLVLPIQGEGNSEMKMKDFQLSINFTAEGFDKSGKRFIKLGKPSVDIDISRFYCKLENLFNGDKALSDEMNKFLNDNWRVIYEELKPAIIEAFAGVSSAVINNVVNNVSYEELFIESDD